MTYYLFYLFLKKTTYQTRGRKEGWACGPELQAQVVYPSLSFFTDQLC